jgi:hypothetical protein
MMLRPVVPFVVFRVVPAGVTPGSRVLLRGPVSSQGDGARPAAALGFQAGPEAARTGAGGPDLKAGRERSGQARLLCSAAVMAGVVG